MMMMNYCILILLNIIFLLCRSGCAPPQGERDRKPTTAELEPQGTSVSVVNAARGDQSSVIRYDYQIYPSVSPGRDLKYIIKYNQRYNAISDLVYIAVCIKHNGKINASNADVYTHNNGHFPFGYIY